MIVFMIAYVAVLIGIAVYSSRRVSSGEDFLLAGRRMGPWMTAFAYGTSYFSAVVFIGYAGQFGWGFGASATWIGIGNAVIGSLLAWLVLGRRTRSMTQRLDAKTMPEFLESRYQSPKLKLVAAVVVFAFLLPYSASVFQGISYLFETLIGLPFIWCVVGIVVLTGVYLVAGGYLATALTDFFQGIIMLVGIVLVVVFVLKSPQVGGLQAGLDKLAAIDPNLTHPWGGA
ncbi:MAG: sodium:solute symporter family transporter, partial [Christensenellaceae bacterium]